MNSPKIRTKLDQFFTQYTRQTFPHGHILIPAFSTPAGAYYLASGHVKQYSLTPDGHELVVNIYKPGTFFPMIWAVTGYANNFFFETLDPVTVFRAPKDETIAFLKSNTDVLYDLLTRLYVGLDGMLVQMTQNALGDTRKKVVASLLMAGKRFGESKGATIHIHNHFTHKEIGLLSGTSRETVTRTLSQLEKENLIAFDHKTIILLSLAKLEQILVSE